MPEQILDILAPLRRRYLLTRLAEGLAVGGVLGGVLAAALMAGWILAGPYPLPAAALALLPALLSAALIAFKPARRMLGASPTQQWTLAGWTIALALAGAVLLAGRFYPVLPKNALLCWAPLTAILGGILAMVGAGGLSKTALAVDRQAGLPELISTSLEFASQQSGFAQAVHAQAAAVWQSGRLRRVRFWTRSRAIGAALGLSVLAAGLLAACPMLESAQQRQQRLWLHVAPDATAELRQQIEALSKKDLAAPAVRRQLAKLEQMLAGSEVLTGRQAAKWQECVVEFQEAARQLELAVQQGKLDPSVAREMARLIRSLEESAEKIAAGMSQTGTEYIAGNRSTSEPPAVSGTHSDPTGWARLYDPRYAPFATTATSSPETPSPDGGAGEIALDQAWLDACRQAAHASENPSLPAEYRQLIRDFFANRN